MARLPSVTNTLSASGDTDITSVPASIVGRVVASFKGTGAGSYTVKPQKRVHQEPGGAGTAPTQHAFVDCAYTLATENSQAGGTKVTSGTTQPGDCVIDVDASGCDIKFVVAITPAMSVSCVQNVVYG